VERGRRRSLTRWLADDRLRRYVRAPGNVGPQGNERAYLDSLIGDALSVLPGKLRLDLAHGPQEFGLAVNVVELGQHEHAPQAVARFVREPLTDVTFSRAQTRDKANQKFAVTSA